MAPDSPTSRSLSCKRGRSLHSVRNDAPRSLRNAGMAPPRPYRSWSSVISLTAWMRPNWRDTCESTLRKSATRDRGLRTASLPEDAHESDDQEARLTPDVNQDSYRLASTLYERRRRRFESAGLPFTDRPPVLDTSGGRQLSVCETLRRCAEQRRARWRAEQFPSRV